MLWNQAARCQVLTDGFCTQSRLSPKKEQVRRAGKPAASAMSCRPQSSFEQAFGRADQEHQVLEDASACYWNFDRAASPKELGWK